jgi:hypothetical protein
MIAVTGKIERVTDFEKALPDALVERDGNIQSETITEFKRIKPEVIIPMHCTGWRAIKRFSEEFPSSFILNSVGTKIGLKARILA